MPSSPSPRRLDKLSHVNYRFEKSKTKTRPLRLWERQFGSQCCSASFFALAVDVCSLSFSPHPRLARALDILFILHADHELNCSTAAMRHLSSSGVDVFTAIAGAAGALYGPRHGGANEAVLRMLQKIGTVDQIPAFIEKVKSKQVRLMGFGQSKNTQKKKEISDAAALLS